MLKTIVILNPAARSERAGGLSPKIEELAMSEADLRLTSSPGEAGVIAAQAVRDGFEQIVAAGGDGTVNEVVNGLAGTAVALGILPVGSMNVFAAQLGLPKTLKECWDVIRAGQTREIDLAEARPSIAGRRDAFPGRAHAFVQLAGVGLDAQVVQATSREFKRDFGPLSYLISAAQIAARKPPRLLINHNGNAIEGSFVLIGNGRYYGGPFPVFPNARIDDQLLDVLVFRKVGYLDIVRYMNGVLFGTHMDLPDVISFRAEQLTVTSEEPVPVEVDGEVIGEAPVTFGFHPKRLRVLAPTGKG